MRPRRVVDALEEAVWDRASDADEVYTYLTHLEAKEARLEKLEQRLNKAEDEKRDDIVKFFEDFKV